VGHKTDAIFERNHVHPSYIVLVNLSTTPEIEMATNLEIEIVTNTRDDTLRRAIRHETRALRTILISITVGRVIANHAAAFSLCRQRAPIGLRKESSSLSGSLRSRA